MLGQGELPGSGQREKDRAGDRAGDRFVSLGVYIGHPLHQQVAKLQIAIGGIPQSHDVVVEIFEGLKSGSFC